jgi:hypothetical protein
VFIVVSSLDPNGYSNPKDYESEQEAQVRFWMSFIKACSVPENVKPVVVMVGSRADEIKLTQPFHDLAAKMRSEFKSVLNILPNAFLLDCRDDVSSGIKQLKTELALQKKLILQNCQRKSPKICEDIRYACVAALSTYFRL